MDHAQSVRNGESWLSATVDKDKAAYKALLADGRSGFDAVPGGKGGQALYRQTGSEKVRAFPVRCIQD